MKEEDLLRDPGVEHEQDEASEDEALDHEERHVFLFVVDPSQLQVVGHPEDGEQKMEDAWDVL